METHKIDQLFKQKLDRHSEPVSADAFAKVQAQMKGKKQKKGFPWMIAASISILLLISFGLVYNYNQTDKQDLAQIDLGSAQISLLGTEQLRIPEIERENSVQQKAISTPTKQGNPTKLKVEEVSRMASLEKMERLVADLKIENVPQLRLAPKKHKNKVVVEIHYAYAETKKEESIISKSNNKLKSLASEFSLADLRSAKNELFASALQFNKKGNN